jgi:PAS domain S-box-containing protein
VQFASDAQAVTPELFRAIVQQASDAMIYADREGIIRIWNAAAEAIFGHGAAEVVGMSLDVIIPERFRGAHWTGFRKAVESGQSKYGGRVMTTRGTHKSGSAVYVDLSFALIKDSAGVVVGTLAIGRDGTERHRSRGTAPGT